MSAANFAAFVSAILGVLASRFGAQTLSVLLVPMLLFGVYFDVVFTLLRRAVSGDRITEAHRSHLYQIAHRSGMRPAMVTLVHWGMVAWGGLCCVAFHISSGGFKPLIPIHGAAAAADLAGLCQKLGEPCGHCALVGFWNGIRQQTRARRARV